MGLSCLRYPRNTANRGYCSVLLGQNPCCIACDKQPYRLQLIAYPDLHNTSHRRSSLVYRSGSLYIFANLLPPKPWKDSKLLQNSPSQKNHRLVLRCCDPAKLLPLCAIWPKLGVPLEFTACPTMGDSSSCCRVFHSSMGCRFAHLWSAKQESFLDSSYLCDWSWGTSLGPNSLGYIFVGLMVALVPRWSGRRCTCWKSFVALAWTA